MTTPAQSLDAFRRLLPALLDFPDELVVSVHDGAAGYLRVTVSDTAFTDRGKLFGTGGCHSRALAFVASMMGEKIGQTWAFKASLPRLESRAPEKGMDVPRPDSHDVTEDLRLIEDVLRAVLDGEPAVTVLPEKLPGDYTFRIKAKTHADDSLLRETVPFHTVKQEDGSRVPYMTSLERELGTLFRAIAKRKGVNYYVTLT